MPQDIFFFFLWICITGIKVWFDQKWIAHINRHFIFTRHFRVFSTVIQRNDKNYQANPNSDICLSVSTEWYNSSCCKNFLSPKFNSKNSFGANNNGINPLKVLFSYTFYILSYTKHSKTILNLFLSCTSQ